MSGPVVAVLEVMWGRSPGEAPRWFRINPRNHSGRRLIQVVGSEEFWVTNACRELVASPREHPRPDAGWLRENLRALAPRVALVCGRVAQSAFRRDMVPTSCAVVEMPHPAARALTTAQIRGYAEAVRLAIGASQA